MGDVVEHRAHGGLDRGVPVEALGELLRVRADGRVRTAVVAATANSTE
ncbi:hypothetical protein MF406_01405 [Georgenia sp. TF02-10]|nr:hypothetical protein [Georgenia sp. TF02-10]UNX54974.1 hypothetical protein MF406_01405 [Georgenia sp. TF02-10]